MPPQEEWEPQVKSYSPMNLKDQLGGSSTSSNASGKEKDAAEDEL